MRPSQLICTLVLTSFLSLDLTAQSTDSVPNPQQPGIQRSADAERKLSGANKKRQDRGERDRGGKKQRARRDIAQMLKRLDRNGDGVIVEDELPAALQSRFQRMDSNGDGVFDKDEQYQLQNRFSKMRDPSQPLAGGGSRRGNPQQMIRRMDQNGDGQITKDELPNRLKQRFDMLDEDGNGVFDPAEQQRLIERMRNAESRGANATRGQGKTNPSGKKMKNRNSTRRRGKREDRRGVVPKRPPGIDGPDN